MDYAWLDQMAAGHGLAIFGGLHPGPQDGAPPGCQTLILLMTREPGFWRHLTAQAEWSDGQRDPIDRWSKRVLSEMAENYGGQAIFPSDGPPYPPFLAWARATGRAWNSPAGMLVHERAGLMISLRGALALPQHLSLPGEGSPEPCPSCVQSCATSCPVDALGPEGYNVEACHAYLDLPEGRDCMDNGCKARRACPISAMSGRLAEQSAYHMREFHK